MIAFALVEIAQVDPTDALAVSLQGIAMGNSVSETVVRSPIAAKKTGDTLDYRRGGPENPAALQAFLPRSAGFFRP
jgi:hypothetical protein